METKLRNEIKIALSNKLKEKTTESDCRYQTLKNILETAQKMAKEKKTEVTDNFIIDAAKREIKQLNELLSYGENAEATYCISVAEEFLPKMASEDEIKEFLSTIELKNIGLAMKALKKHFGNSFDGKMASQIVREMLN